MSWIELVGVSTYLVAREASYGVFLTLLSRRRLSLMLGYPDVLGRTWGCFNRVSHDAQKTFVRPQTHVPKALRRRKRSVAAEQ